MKAIQILECLIYMGEDSENFNLVTIFEEDREEILTSMFGQTFFDGEKEEIPAGKYFYYWTSETLETLANGHENFVPDGFILTHKYNSEGIPMAINFYHVDED